MLQNNLKIAWRNLLRNRSHAFINVFGLAIGIACCLLILLWVTDELSYDKWNEKADRIYRIAPEINFGGSHQHFAVCPAPLAGALRADFPEVESSVRFRNYGSSLVKRDVHNFKEENIIYTDSSLFEVFSLNLIKGDSKTALIAPNSTVISKTTADKYFPEEDPIGKTLTLDNTTDLTITGVIEDMPSNSHFNFDFFISLEGIEEANNGIWVSHNFPTYYVLRPGTDAKTFEAKVFPHLLEKYISPQTSAMMGMSYEELEKSGAFIKYHYQALNDIHLHSDLVAELAPNSSIQYVWIFLAAAIFILMIACVNFMNLSTARSTLRAKEIGIRKVLGSMRSTLVSQFLSESLVMASLAFLLGLMLAQISLPYYNDLANKQLVLPFASGGFWFLSIASIILIGLMAGIYPALFLSGFKPIRALSGKFFEKHGSVNLRSGLVVFQFLIALMLIAATLVIQEQMDFIQDKKMGFDREQVLVINDAYALNNNLEAYKNQMLQKTEVINASVSSFLPVPSSRSDSPLCKSSEIREDNCVAMQIWDVDEGYISTLGMELLDGRNFSPDMPTDSNAIIINETAARLFGLENPVGENIYGSRRFNPEGGHMMEPLKIIGVVKDFHFESLRENIRALSFILSPSTGNLSLKIKSNDPASLIASAERMWKEMAPEQPFSYSFLNERFDRMYRSERRISNIFSIFSILSIFVACLGLLGLAAFATERRTKEMGVRKVLGASIADLVGLISKDFLKLVGIAIIIATPIAWFLMGKWLESFAYRIELHWSIFVLTGILSIFVAFFTISFQSFKAALANPIEALRDE